MDQTRLQKHHELFNNACHNKPVELFKSLEQKPPSWLQMFTMSEEIPLDINWPNHSCHGKTALHVACQNGNLICVRILLKDPAIDINRTDSTGNTPLHFACWTNRSECVQTLLLSGASVDSTCKKGRTALWLASHSGHSRIVDMLLVHASISKIQLNNSLESFAERFNSEKGIMQLANSYQIAQTAEIAQRILEFTDDSSKCAQGILDEDPDILVPGSKKNEPKSEPVADITRGSFQSSSSFVISAPSAVVGAPQDGVQSSKHDLSQSSSRMDYEDRDVIIPDSPSPERVYNFLCFSFM